MLPPELNVKRISQFTLQNNELNAKVLYTFQKPTQYYYWDKWGCSASVEFYEGLYIEYIDCIGIKKPLLCSTVSITRHWEGSVTVRLFGPEEKDGFRREESCTCTKLFYDKRIVSVRDLYVNLRTFIFLNSRHSVLREPTSKPLIEIRNTERFLNS